ncbi:RNA-binding S4 domain-containing protein [Mycoplasmopsis iners]|uniref:RNA-binding S4 domain-containing protein n=1 Tax=Mycoplasmopsis iners TaxID=76630 RepID=UPI000496ED3A|nr:RNA-binding S4 domain-containing protein [Mycoplasmopsis iners]
MNIIKIKDDFITLGQFLKKARIIDTGGQAKYFLLMSDVKNNDRKPNGRNAKVYVNDVVWVDNILYQVVKED